MHHNPIIHKTAATIAIIGTNTANVNMSKISVNIQPIASFIILINSFIYLIPNSVLALFRNT